MTAGPRPKTTWRQSTLEPALFAATLLVLGHVPAEGSPVDSLETPEAFAADPLLVGQAHELAGDDRIARALELLRQREPEIQSLQVRIAATPAENWRAPRRAALFDDLLRDAGLRDVHRDATGNVLGRLRGSDSKAPAVLLSGHLDTVFPDLETIHVEHQGTILRAPGIGDDAAGLAAVVHLARALRDAKVPLRRDIVVVGTVGEEGEGDLRGVKGLFAGEYPPERVHAFLSLDLGTQAQIVNEGIGSRRLHAVVEGPGGHSWGDFGRPNPIDALARAIVVFLETPQPRGSRNSFNIGTIEGGRGVNVIPESAALRVDLRSEVPALLDELEASFRSALDSGLARERAWSRNNGELRLEVQTIGDRPVGRTPPESAVVRIAIAAFASQSMPMILGSSSTDANLPMSLGVPAVALPHGCQGHDAHSRSEWCDTTGRSSVLAAELVLTVLLAELDGSIQKRRQPAG